MKKLFNAHMLPLLIVSGLLFGALADHGYGYYTMLRWIVCGASIFVALKFNEQKLVFAVWAFSGMAIIFNPIIKIHFDKNAWHFIDAIVGCVFLVGTFFIQDKNS